MHINESLASVSISIKAEVSAVCLSEEFMCVDNTLLRRKDIDDDLREAIVAPINVGRVMRSFTDKVRLFIAQANCKEPESFISDYTGKC